MSRCHRVCCWLSHICLDSSTVAFALAEIRLCGGSWLQPWHGYELELWWGRSMEGWVSDHYNEEASFFLARVLKHCRVLSQSFQFCCLGSVSAPLSGTRYPISPTSPSTCIHVHRSTQIGIKINIKQKRKEGLSKTTKTTYPYRQHLGG